MGGRIERGLVRGVGALTVLGGAVIVASLITGVFFRYVMQSALSWTDEVAMFCFSWTVLLAAALLVHESGHVRVELIETWLPETAVRVLRALIQVLILVTGAYMVWTGWNFMDMTVGQTAPATRYPIWVRNLALPVAGVLIVVFSLFNLRHGGWAPEAESPGTAALPEGGDAATQAEGLASS